MAIEKVTRVLVAVHEDRREELLSSLQRSGILHIVSGEATGTPDTDPEAARTLAGLVAAVEALAPLEGRKGGLLGGNKTTMSQNEFDRVAAEYDPRPELDRFGQLTGELAELDVRAKTLGAEVERLRPWQGLRSDPRDLLALTAVDTAFGVFPDSDSLARFESASIGMPVSVQVVAQSGDGVVAVVLSSKSPVADVEALLSASRFELFDIQGVAGRPADVIAGLEDELAQLGARRIQLQKELKSLAAALPRMRVAADAASARVDRATAAAALESTAAVSFIHGWVRTRDYGHLQRIVGESGVAAIDKVEPAPEEQPPVALTNPRFIRPFELVLELFSMPLPTELDPTAIITPFFAVFFALCLTDAGYGIVVAVLTYVLMRKMGMNNKILGIVLIGAILTIPAGALVGGWFGDIPDRLGIGWLQLFKNKLMWFDPVKDPMKFFVISIALGYLQMIAGIAFEIVDCLRVRNYGDGLLGQLPWFVGINALVARVLLAKSLPTWAGAVLVVLVLASVAAIVVYTQRSRDTRLSQALWFFLMTFLFVYFGAKLRWLPQQLLAAKWVFVGLIAVMFVYAAWSVVRSRSYKPVPVGLAVLGLGGIGLYFGHVLAPGIAFLPALLFILLSPASRSIGAKLGWGAYALYGATGYIGVVLSYIRLMALGMCTGGVAVAINVIAWMLVPIPVVGIIGALIVLVIGHTYNIAVNVLGAFVHSLRLQYVEFFPRFYTGGGERFAPFRASGQFVNVKSS